MQIILALIFILVVIAFIMVTLFFIQKHNINRISNTLKQISEKYNLEYLNEKEIKGVFENQEIYIYKIEETETYVYEGEEKEYEKENLYIEINPLYNLSYGINHIIRRQSDSEKNIIGFKTGDPNFDKYILIDPVDEGKVLSRLNVFTRSKIYSHMSNKYGLSMTNNLMKYKNVDFLLVNWERFMDNMIYISKKLSDPKSTDELLMYNIKNNYDMDSVKIRNMEYLLDFPKIDEYQDFLISMTDNPVPEIQIMAAYGLKKEGIPKLVEILKNVNDEKKIFSLKYISKIYDHDQIKKIVYSYLDSEDENLITECINLFIKNKDLKSIKAVADLIKNHGETIEDSKLLKLSLIKYTSTLKVKENFNWLTDMLNLDKEKKEVIISAVNAFKELNDIKAVEHLLPLTKIIFNNDIKKSAQDAINILQQNIPNKNRGTLTMMEESLSGELSVDDENDSGKLTLE